MPRTLEVFEHARLDVSSQALTNDEFDALVRFNDEARRVRHVRYFEIGHKHIRTRHFVGYVQVGDLAIEILPKADRDAPADARPWREGLLEMLRVAGGLTFERLPDASQRLSRRPLIELIARAYLAEVVVLLHEGLAKGYRAVENNGSVFRGRLKVAEHLRANIARADRFYVEYPVFDHHVAINRVVLAALEVLSWCALPSDVAATIEHCMARFPDLMTGGIDSATIDRIHLARSTQRYAAALVYARLILSQQGPALRAGRERVFALLFDMNVLWERYVAALVRRAAPQGFHADTQESVRLWAPEGRPRRSIRPDIVLRDGTGQARLVIDTKWKVPGNGLPSDDDLKQMFVYNELLGCPRAVLLYPRTARSTALGGRYTGRSHSCHQRHLGVIAAGHWRTPSVLDDLRGILSEFLAGADSGGVAAG